MHEAVHRLSHKLFDVPMNAHFLTERRFEAPRDIGNRQTAAMASGSYLWTNWWKESRSRWRFRRALPCSVMIVFASIAMRIVAGRDS